jgi:hypothetical protein
MTRPRWTRGTLVVGVVLGLTLLGMPGAAPAPAGWSIKLTGALEGTAKKVKPQCVASSADDAPLLAQAAFILDGKKMRFSAYFAPPASAGSRTFSQTPSSSTVLVSISDVADPSASWTSAGTGAATLDDGRSGSIDGTLTGASGDIQVAVTFRCPKPRGGSGSGEGDHQADDDRGGYAPDFNGTIEATTSGHCSGTETGTVFVVGLRKNRVEALITAGGSYTCQGITVPTDGAMIYSGTFKNHTLALSLETLLGLLLSPPGCQVGQRLTIRIRDGSGRVNPKYTAPSGDLYECTIEVEQR